MATVLLFHPDAVVAVPRRLQPLPYTQNEIDGLLANHANLQPYAGYIRQVANAFIAANGECEQFMRDMSMGDAIQSASAIPGHQLTGARLRETLLDCLGQLYFGEPNPPVAAAALVPPVPAGPPPAPPLPPDRTVDRQRLQRFRTARATRRGLRLAASAVLLQDWFHWVPSGPADVGTNAPYAPNQQNNRFAEWMNTGGQQPQATWHLNCWESVFVAAYRAGLVTYARLSQLHDMATAIARKKNNGSAYYDTLCQALGFKESVAMDPAAGLIPVRGDVIFFDQQEHVVIALGRVWEHGAPRDRIMSLWHNNNGRMASLTFEDFPPVWLNGTPVRYAPCPF